MVTAVGGEATLMTLVLGAVQATRITVGRL
jgi:hypothetical protein